jgi:hypothetical protein
MKRLLLLSIFLLGCEDARVKTERQPIALPLNVSETATRMCDGLGGVKTMYANTAFNPMRGAPRWRTTVKVECNSNATVTSEINWSTI